MKDKTYDIPVKCLFCNCTLKVDTETEYKSGDLLKCQECGEDNDYDSLIQVTKDTGSKVVMEDVKKDIEKEFKNIFKKFK